MTKQSQLSVSMPMTPESLIDILPHAAFWKDRDGRFLGCNQRLLKDLDISSVDELIGRTDYDIPCVTREQAEFFIRCDKAVMELGNPMVNIVEAQQRPDGSTAWLLTTKVPLRNEHGSVIGVFGTYLEVRAADMRLLSDVASHEINNPLAIILLQAELAMPLAESNPEVRERLQSIISQVRRCSAALHSLHERLTHDQDN